MIALGRHAHPDASVVEGKVIGIHAASIGTEWSTAYLLLGVGRRQDGILPSAGVHVIRQFDETPCGLGRVFRQAMYALLKGFFMCPPSSQGIRFTPAQIIFRNFRIVGEVDFYQPLQ